MEMFVCIKQVPATNKVEVDETTGVLKRNGVSCKMNPYDLYALENGAPSESAVWRNSYCRHHGSASGAGNH